MPLLQIQHQYTKGITHDTNKGEQWSTRITVPHEYAVWLRNRTSALCEIIIRYSRAIDGYTPNEVPIHIPYDSLYPEKYQPRGQHLSWLYLPSRITKHPRWRSYDTRCQLIIEGSGLIRSCTIHILDPGSLASSIILPDPLLL